MCVIQKQKCGEKCKRCPFSRLKSPQTCNFVFWSAVASQSMANTPCCSNLNSFSSASSTPMKGGYVSHPGAVASFGYPIYKIQSKSSSRKHLSVSETGFCAGKGNGEHLCFDCQDAASDGAKIIDFPHVQTLRNFPNEEIFEKVVMVRFDPMVLLHEKEDQSPPANALYTIKYLYEAGARVIIVGSWSETTNSSLPSGAYPSTESVAEYLSLVLELKVVPVKFSERCKHSGVEESKNHDILLLENLFYLKGELANCSKFAKELATGVDIVVNDAFSQSHKVLASTVGIASFCPAYVAGFYFEEGLYKLKKLIWTSENPYMAIIGGGNLADKAAALQILASTCDGLVFVGSLAFQVMHALGVPVPMEFVELGALKDAISIVESAKSRNIPLAFPKDVWCINNHNPEQLEIFSVTSITKGWQPVDIGPRSLQEMIYLLSTCKVLTNFYKN